MSRSAPVFLRRHQELMRISLVGTVHEENGLANVVELQAILERLQPDLIFAEIPSAYVDQYRDGSHGTLESTAVGRYRESHQVAVVPVDLPKPEAEFFSNAKDLFAKVGKTSPDFCLMMDRNNHDTRTGGFPYLNSDRCVQSWEDIQREISATVDWIGVPQLREIYDLWSHTNDRRETEMMKNIEDYCVRNVFVHGLFLVGAKHRKAIVDKARAGVGTGSPRIEWDLGGFLRGPI